MRTIHPRSASTTIVEQLEPRRLLAAEVLGTAGDDSIIVEQLGPNLVVRVNGVPTLVDSAMEDEVIVRGQQGNDEILVISRGDFDLQIFGGAGDNTVRIGDGRLGDLGDPTAALFVDTGSNDIGEAIVFDDSETTDAASWRINGSRVRYTTGGPELDMTFVDEGNVTFLAGAGNDFFLFNDAPADGNAAARPILDGGDGDDYFQFIRTPGTPNATSTVRGGPGRDFLELSPAADTVSVVRIDEPQSFALLQINEGGTVVLEDEGSVTTDSLPEIGGTLDVGDQFVIARADGALNLETARDLARRGYDDASWAGTPTLDGGVINSSVAAVSTLADGVGVARVGAGPAELDLASFRGVAVSSGDQIIAYTLAGDANLDGTVSLADFNRLRNAFGGSGAFTQGDFDYSGGVNLNDFNLLRNSFGLSLPGPSASIFSDEKLG
jgi:hypothetical protein